MKIGDASLEVWLETDDRRMYCVEICSSLRGRRKKHVYDWAVEYYADPENEDAEPKLVSAGREKAWGVAHATAFQQAELYERKFVPGRRGGP